MTSTDYKTQTGHYNGLFTAGSVHRRDDIYGSAPIPPLEVNGDIRRLSSLLTGRILDFGCGRGGLLRELRQRGLDAQGIEVKNDLLRSSLAEGVAPHVRFYDGSLPLPFEDRAFGSVVAAEVIEHIPHSEAIIAEIARITATTFIATVPDMSSIPTCFPHYVVPLASARARSPQLLHAG
ncbi:MULTISPECIES: bifunctional 2-polyprenyl-6-hydroxyphenol methylase/3-demethylubiquinol 3-O-methyltransferase UbiG [Rhodoplanes]|uniref:class I SAM-dependent methyltransferase n=1 Tax=Rhodoplanes TaxID=29407 RepID=UPI001A9394E1|nr:class I SAM-dependent methyltransferase [Rhodoplanes serenus]